MTILELLIFPVIFFPVILGIITTILTCAKKDEKALRLLFFFIILNVIYMTVTTGLNFLFFDKLPLGLGALRLFPVFINLYALPFFVVSLIICCIRWHKIKHSTNFNQKNKELILFRNGADNPFAYAINEEGVLTLSPMDIEKAYTLNKQLSLNNLTEVDVKDVPATLQNSGIGLYLQNENDQSYFCIYNGYTLIHKEPVESSVLSNCHNLEDYFLQRGIHVLYKATDSKKSVHSSTGLTCFLLISTILMAMFYVVPSICGMTDIFKAVHNIKKSEIIICDGQGIMYDDFYAITDEGLVDLSPIDIRKAYEDSNQQILSNKLVEIDADAAREKLKDAGIEITLEGKKDKQNFCIYKDEKRIYKEKAWTDSDSNSWSIMTVLTLGLFGVPDEKYDALEECLAGVDVRYFYVEK